MSLTLRDKTTRTRGTSNYRDIECAIQSRRPFAGNSMSAHYVGGTYVVASYWTIIALAWPGGDIEISENFWGPTSGRHINICKRGL